MKKPCFKVEFSALKVIAIVAIAAIIVTAIILFGVPNAEPIVNAEVNRENGDIAISYVVYKDREAYVRIEVYDSLGRHLFSRDVYDDGQKDVHLAFCGEVLYVYLGVKNEFCAFDRNGEVFKNYELTQLDLIEKPRFDGWTNGFNTFSITVEDVEYRYYNPWLFNRKATLIIVNSEADVEKVIYTDD